MYFQVAVEIYIYIYEFTSPVVYSYIHQVPAELVFPSAVWPHCSCVGRQTATRLCHQHRGGRHMQGVGIWRRVYTGGGGTQG